ncbi:10733_t:CDS:1 [Acaulospora morrowiae]|uniref:10733_t:CDS:1 n=1 Tax=Acaulospora morrowiae TaxID=94023 RepID=A0A9N9C6Q2_9GLOM|nr:10733_t:CDS:1 [Acaulospora morrowiae]
MATIKVVHETATRRFTLSPNSTFSGLESQLRTLFFIPPSTPVTVSYTDDEGDNITISSDLELQEIISQQSAGHPIKLFLNTSTGHARDNGPIVTSRDTEEIPETQPKSESRPSSAYRHVGFADEETEEQLYEFIADESNKEKSERQESSESSVRGQEKEKENKENEDDDDVIFIKFNRPPSFGPLFDLFGTLEFEPFGLGQFPFGSTFGPSFGGCQNYRNYGAKNHCGRNSSGYNSSSRFNKTAEYSRAGPCVNGYGPRPECRRFRGYHNFNQHLTSEQLADKLKTLNSMGFVYDNAKYEDLLKRYNGNVGRVVEILLREQEESDKASSSKSEEQSFVENEQETAQYFVPVVEVDPENRPYSL